jgi:di/tricarboxylate transporter
MEITLVLLILFIALILFVTEWIRMDLVSMMVLILLALTEVVTVKEAFSGFSNPAVITVAAMFIISAGLTNTGALAPVGERLLTFSGNSEFRLIVSIMLIAALFSAFINNIGAAAMLMPLVVSVGQKSRISPSKLLIPLAFGSLLGGVCTLIGTPPNILMNELLKEYTGESFSMFSFTPVGVIILTTGVLYMAFIGRFLLPNRKAGTLTEAYQVKEYITEAKVLEDSPFIGKSISQAGLDRRFGLNVRAILRGRQKYPFPRRNRKILANDTLFLEGDPQAILKVREGVGLTIVPEQDNPVLAEMDKSSMIVVEASLSPNSELVGKTLREVHFANTYGMTVLAIWRSGAPVVRKVDHVVLRFGDVLLLQGHKENAIHIGNDHGFLLMGDVSPVTYRPQKAPIAVATLLGVIILAASGILPIMLSASLGALLMVLFRCLRTREIYQTVNWQILVLIAGTLPLGIAMEKSGAAHVIAEQIILVVGPWGPWAVLSAVFLITFALTEVMSHAAAAVLVAPIAYNTALDLAVSPKPFFMAVAVAASSCFMTPISHQSNALVMGPGGYRFFDYIKTGTPLNLLIWLVASLMIPIFFPF